MPYRNRRTRRILATTNLILLLASLIALGLLAWQFRPKTVGIDQMTKTSQTNKTTKNNKSQVSQNQTSTWTKQDQPIKLPILMYHAVHVMAAEEADNANLILDPTTFEEQIKAMVQAGYYFLSPEEAYRALTENSLPQKKVVWLTFDDSLIDFYTVAYPILQKYGVKATNNVITSYTEEGRAGNLTIEQMLEMKARGMSFQSHSSSHPDLEYADPDRQSQELTSSKSFLDTNLKQDTMTIAYPAGRYSDSLLQLTQQNYKLGLTTNEGLASADNGLLTLKRIRILPTMTAQTLLNQLQE